MDEQGCLTPSTRLVDVAGMTEAEVVQDVFQRMAAGGTTSVAEANRFNALGIPTTRYHTNGTARKAGQRWYPTRIAQMIACETYRGVHIYASRFGTITRDVPKLVKADLWAQANAQLQANRKLPKGNASRRYLLRGLITCGLCGASYVGQAITYRSGNPGAFYRCGGRRPHHFARGERCDAKAVQAGWLEDIVWEDCRAFIRNPGEALAEAQRQLQARQQQSATLEQERSTYLQALAEKTQERDRVMTVFRRGRSGLTLEDAEQQLAAIVQEEASLRAHLAALDAQAALVDAFAEKPSR